MLRDDAIRAGLLNPTQDDIQRMSLTKEDISLSAKFEYRTFDTADSGPGIEAQIDLADLTQKELAKKARKMGIKLPPRFIKKTELIEKIRSRL